jgi:hypothetical protein
MASSVRLGCVKCSWLFLESEAELRRGRGLKYRRYLGMVCGRILNARLHVADGARSFNDLLKEGDDHSLADNFSGEDF